MCLAAIGTWCALTTLWYYFVGAAPKVEYSCVGELRRDKVILPSLVSTGAAAFVPKYGRPLNKVCWPRHMEGGCTLTLAAPHR